MSIFKMPSLGADMESAILMEWLVKEGDNVKKGDIIAEIEASKGVIEIEVFEDGVIERLLVDEETECLVGAPLALIRSAGETVADLEAALAQLTGQPIPETQTPEPAVQEQPAEPPLETTEQKEQSAAVSQRLQISPAARRRAGELGVDIQTLDSTGKEVIQIADVEALAQKMPATVQPTGPSKVQEPTKSQTDAPDSMRQAIAAAMSRSNAEIPHYYLSTSINMTPALQWLEQRNADRSINERILPAAVLLYATVQALKKVPALNGFWRNGGHEISEAIHPGFAIALRKGGLITPALLDAQAKDLDQTMQAMGDLITRTRASKLRGSELTEQTITITNLGDLGVESVYGVIYPPQVALIGFGKIEERPWVDADGGLGIRKVMRSTLAGDHRATDGRTGAQFLDRLKQILENPQTLNGVASD